MFERTQARYGMVQGLYNRRPRRQRMHKTLFIFFYFSGGGGTNQTIRKTKIVRRTIKKAGAFWTFR
jgi:acetyl esterase/lipase